MESANIDHINMVVPNLSVSLNWYTKVLGFSIKGRFSEGNFEIAYIDNGSVVYELFENPQVETPVIDHIAYKSDDIEASHAYYKNQGVRISPIAHIDFVWERGVDYFFIWGAGGEKIEFLQVL